MLDKNELEDLLVKLRLGTISIESAVNEIEQNFYSAEDNDSLTVWQKLGCPFDEMVECMYTVGKGMPVELRETALGGCAKTPTACSKCLKF